MEKRWKELTLSRNKLGPTVSSVVKTTFSNLQDNKLLRIYAMSRIKRARHPRIQMNTMLSVSYTRRLRNSLLFFAKSFSLFRIENVKFAQDNFHLNLTSCHGSPLYLTPKQNLTSESVEYVYVFTKDKNCYR